MPALNFKPQFVRPILAGKKPGTIRASRKNPIKPGDFLYLYTGLRTKNCKKFGSCMVLSVYRIQIHPDFVMINGKKIIPIVRCYLAALDGFPDITSFNQFFQSQYNLPFVGDWIVWNMHVVSMMDEYLKSLLPITDDDINKFYMPEPPRIA